MRYIITLFLLISVCFGQSWQPINGKQRFTTGLGVPTKDTSTNSTADTSMITIRPQDSALWVKYKGSWYKVPRITDANPNAILNGGNTFGVPIVIGSNDNKNVGFIRNGSTYLSLGGGREYFGTSQNYWVDTVGNMFGQLWKGLNSYTSTSLNIPYDTLPPPTGVWDTGYISLLATNRSDNHLWLRSGHENGTHNTIWKQIPLSSDLNGYGNTFSQGVIPTSSVAAIPFYNGVHSISYTNNALMDSVTGAIYVNNKRLADTTQLLTVGSNITNASGTISINNSNVVAALGYMPYNASNPSNYIAKSALSATNNSSTSIFSYNSATGAYNFDSTKFAGNDLVFNTGLLGADTSTGATKLATQGYVSRNSSTLPNTCIGVGNSSNVVSGSKAFYDSAGVVNDTATTPEYRLTTSSDTLYSRLQRSATHNATFLRAQTTQIGGYSNAIQFGASGYYQASDAGLPSGNNSFSISIWIYNPSGCGLGANSVTYGVTNPITLQVSCTYVTIFSGATTVFQSQILTYIGWNNIVVTFNGSNLYVYVNNNAYSGTTAFNVGIGGNSLTNYSSLGGGTFVGIQQQLLIYNRALTSTEVSDIYNGGAGTVYPSSSGLIRRYNFSTINLPITGQTPESIAGTYPATLYNSPTLVTGIVPSVSAISEGVPILYQDGVYANELGTAYFGDQNSGTWLRGKSVKTLIGSNIPLITGTNYNTLIFPSNTSANALGLSPLSVSGGATIGTYATTTAAPTNGLLVSGKTGIALSSLNSTDSLQVGGSVLATSYNTSATKTTLNAATSPIYDSTGSIIISYPQQGGDKRCIIYFNGFSNELGKSTTLTFASYTGGSAFTYAPLILGSSALTSVVSSATTTTLTLTTIISPTSGYLLIEGY